MPQICFCRIPEDAFGNFERVAAYCECLKKYGMTLDDNPILCGDYDYETGVNYMREYVHSGSKLPDVFVCANDNIAAGICAEAEQWGCRVPDDFLVTGFDNLDKAAYFRPQITTVFQGREEIGKLLCGCTAPYLGRKTGGRTQLYSGYLYLRRKLWLSE